MLIPARTDTRVFHKYIYGKAEIRFLRGRLKFGGSKWNAPFPSMVVVYRPKGADAMKQYCRYCAYCFEGDCFYCSCHERVLAETSIRSVNRCRDYVKSELGDVASGRQYRPRRKEAVRDVKGQLRMEI